MIWVVTIGGSIERRYTREDVDRVLAGLAPYRAAVTIGETGGTIAATMTMEAVTAEAAFIQCVALFGEQLGERPRLTEIRVALDTQTLG